MVIIVPCTFCCGGVRKTVRLLFCTKEIRLTLSCVESGSVPFDEQGVANHQNVIHRNKSSLSKLGACMSELQKYLPA